MGLASVRRGLALLVLSLALACAPARAGEPPAPTDTVASVDAEWAAVRNPTAVEYRRFLARYKALPDGKERARAIARELIETTDPNDGEARAALGHKEFAHEVPEEISYRRYPFVRIVEEAGAQRWFEDPVPYANALEAFIACQKHAARLTDDLAYSSLDVARRGIDQDEYLRSYNYDAIFASPFLICYSTKERIDEAALWKLPKAERAKAWAELDARRVPYKRVLAEKARIYTQVYARFLAQYGEACDLKSLMDPYGGRPEYPVGKRSFREGCPLTVWVFSDAKAWKAHHEEVVGEPVDPLWVGYLHPHSGRVLCHDHAPEDREGELLANTRLATLSALYWFYRQRAEWGQARAPYDFFTRGFPDWFGSATLGKDRALAFVPWNRVQLRKLLEWKSVATNSRHLMPVFPLRDLLSFEGPGAVRAYGVERWGLEVITLFRGQCWAFFAFLDQAAGGKRRPVIARLLNDYLLAPRAEEGYMFGKARAALGLGTEADWAALDAEFATFYAELLKKDPASIGAFPPALDDWPGYVAPDLLPPTGPVK